MKFLILLLFAFPAICLADTEQKADTTLRSHVMDAETGEALPFANIYVAAGIGTLTNIDGNFTIKTSQDATLRISYVGYEAKTIPATQLKKTVTLKPLAHQLHEVEVLPIESILRKAQKRLLKDYNSKQGKKGHYFYRQLTSTRNKELVEAFVEANNACNLRHLKFLSGHHGRKTAAGLSHSLIADMNFHHPLELGPMTNDVSYWRGLVQPLHFQATLQYWIHNYESTVETIEDAKGQKTYCISMESKLDNRRRAVMTGHLYIDAKTYRLLRFEGKVEGMWVDVRKDFIKSSAPIDLDLHINYRHTNGYTEIENISYEMQSGDLAAKALLFNVDNLSGLNSNRKIKGKKVGENMLESLDATGFDAILWENAGIVQRTAEEDKAAFEGKGDLMATYYDIPHAPQSSKWILHLPESRTGNLVNRLAKFGQVLPQEKVFLHMDNTSYCLGDTLHFAAYLTRTSDDAPSNVSGILYVELLSPDGYILERKSVEMKNGRGAGDFILSRQYYGGFYELRAYTRWQLNWGVFERNHSNISKYWFINKEMEHNYFRDYEKLYSRVFPVYNAPLKAGQYTQNMTLRPLRRYYKKDPDKRRLQLKLYPEGGEPIVGVPCRVAFEASYTDGEFANGTLAIKGKGITASTQNRGRGLFTYIPQEKEKLTATFTALPVFEGEKGEKVTVELPKAESSGVALSISHADSLFHIIIYNNIPDTLALSIMHEGRVRHFFTLTDSVTHLNIPHTDLECGVNQATVFDGDGRVYADRLFFVTATGLAAQNLTFTGIKDLYGPYEKIEIGIHADDSVSLPSGKSRMGNLLSLAIHDNEYDVSLFDNASIMTEMLLSSEIRGFIPSPEWFFEADDSVHRTALDLLMMTQGWRRFVWRDMAIRGAWDLTQPDERTPIVTGSIYNFDPSYFYNNDTYEKLSDSRVDFYAWNDWIADARFDNIKPSGDETITQSKTDLTSYKITRPPEDHSDTEHISTDLMSDIEGNTSNYAHQYEESREVERRSNGLSNKSTIVAHAELVPIGSTETAIVETLVKNGRFRFALPKFYDESVFFLSASDTAKWKNGKHYTWIQDMPGLHDELTTKRKFRVSPAEFSIRVDQPYPRFANPYHFYQSHTDEREDPILGASIMSDGTHRLREVKVSARHSGVREFNDSTPVLQIDGYDAYNFALDAGMVGAEPEFIMRAMVGDYGIDQPYRVEPVDMKKRFNILSRNGYTGTRRAINDMTLNEDSIYMRQNLGSIHSGYTGSTFAEMSRDRRLQRIERYVLYTDYQPRLWGSPRYSNDLPQSIIVVYPYVDGSIRQFYRDRRFILPGIAQPVEFYSPDYSNVSLDNAPADYRRTLYWNPFLPLDNNGNATVTLWNNSSPSRLSISAEGMTSNGTLLSGKQ